jgi:Protein of unknown function (DUF1566)
MPEPNDLKRREGDMNVVKSNNRISAAVALACAGLALARSAGAVDLRDWGRQYSGSERFLVLSQFNNQAVLDKETQLVWERVPAAPLVIWDAARDNCAAKVVGGRAGWRLPSIHELTSLYDVNTGLPTGHPFDLIPPYATNVSNGFWSATVDAKNVDISYTLRFRSDASPFPAYNNGNFALRAWCVRGGGPISAY